MRIGKRKTVTTAKLEEMWMEKEKKVSTPCSETDKGQCVTKHPSSLIHDKGRVERMSNPQKGKTGTERTRGETDCEKWM